MYSAIKVRKIFYVTFLNLLKTEFPRLIDFEGEAIRVGHEVIAKSIGYALELLDKEL